MFISDQTMCDIFDHANYRWRMSAVEQAMRFGWPFDVDVLMACLAGC